MHNGSRAGLAASGAAALAVAGVLLLARDAAAQRSAEEAIQPVAEYQGAAERGLAQAHLGELRVLYDTVRRCIPEVDFHRPGLAFRRPVGIEAAAPHFGMWVWLPGGAPPQGPDLATRAADAFRRYAPRLLPHMLAREAIHGDARVGGYALVLTWRKPPPGTEPPIGETLVVLAPKSAVAPFVEGMVTFAEFLAKSSIRTFDGPTEVTLGRLPVQEPDVPAPRQPPCQR